MRVSPSSGSAARRKVETSITFRPKRTWQRRKRRPMMKQLRKSFLTCWGWAVVRDVEVLGLPLEQQVPHAAPHQVGDESAVLQAVEHLEGVGVDVLAGDDVLRAGEDARRRRFRARASGPIISRAVGRQGLRPGARSPVPPAARSGSGRPRERGRAGGRAAGGTRGRARRASPSGTQRADEEELPPLQLGQGEAVRRARTTSAKGSCSSATAHSRPIILRATCSRSWTSFGVRSARENSSIHSRK